MFLKQKHILQKSPTLLRKYQPPVTYNCIHSLTKSHGVSCTICHFYFFFLYTSTKDWEQNFHASEGYYTLLLLRYYLGILSKFKIKTFKKLSDTRSTIYTSANLTDVSSRIRVYHSSCLSLHLKHPRNVDEMWRVFQTGTDTQCKQFLIRYRLYLRHLKLLITTTELHHSSWTISFTNVF